MPKNPKWPKSITILGRRWFQRTWGNTYHSVEIIVDGKQVHRIPYAYGYGSMYEQNAAEWLEKNGYMPDREHHANGSAEMLSFYCRDRKIELVNRVVDVDRKKDL